MDKLTIGFALECAKDGALWDKYFKGKTLLDVLMTAKNINVETLIRAGVDPKVAIEKMAERNAEGHVGCHGRRIVFVNGKNRSDASLVEKVTPKKVTKVVIRKKDGTTIGRQRYSTGKVVAWNGYNK